MNLDKYGATRIPKFDDVEFSKFDSHHKKHLNNISSDSNILEIWPWNGAFSIYLQRKFWISSSNITLLDLSASTVDLLKSQVETKDFNIVLSDVIEYLSPIQDDSLDVIIMRHVLEHMDREYIWRLVPQLTRVLKKGGLILVEVPNFGNIPLGMWTSFGDFSHVTYFTHETVVEAFIWNSDSTLEIRTMNLFPIFFPLNGSPSAYLKEIYVFLFQWFSIIVSRAFSWSDRFGTGKTYTPLMLATIRKMN